MKVEFTSCSMLYGRWALFCNNYVNKEWSIIIFYVLKAAIFSSRFVGRSFKYVLHHTVFIMSAINDISYVISFQPIFCNHFVFLGRNSFLNKQYILYRDRKFNPNGAKSYVYVLSQAIFFCYSKVR